MYIYILLGLTLPREKTIIHTDIKTLQKDRRKTEGRIW